MNYRHIYHAGNFADVFKHQLLISLIMALSRKDKPLSYVETHAGIGNYDLQSKAAQTTQEFSTGILKLMETPTDTRPELVNIYLQHVMQWNAKQGERVPRYYPGSPCLVRGLLRAQDRMILAELHPEDALSLKAQFSNDPQVAVHHMNGYLALKAFLPPKPSRGLVLIDPPFENPAEFHHLCDHIKVSMQRWPTGTYAIWYPIKSNEVIQQFYRVLQKSGIRKVLCCEIHLPPAGKALTACGMAIIHPPWQWEQEVETLLPWLTQTLTTPQQGSYRMRWLVE